jgi:methyl-accepting chemotaxis protein
MPSLRTQVTGEGDSAVVDVEEVRLAEAAAREIKQESAEPPQKRIPVVLGLAVALASLWAGAASAYLAGYFRAQGASGVWDYQLIGFAVIMVFLPPLLFIAAAFALTRAQSMSETALRLASVSEHLTAADDNAGQTAQRLGRTVRRELDALSTGIDGVFGRLRALETALEDRVAQLEDASARAGVKAETIAQRLQSERESIENLASRLDDVSARATEMLAGRTAQLKAMIESAGGEIRSAGQILETHAGQFRESVELAAAAPRDMALELDRQAKQIENAADTAVARAEFVLARQERQRAAMTELIAHLKEDGKTFDATVEAHCAAAAQAAALLTTEAKHLDEIADQGLRRIDAAMANAESRTTQLATGFGREAERVKETADSAANAVARVVEGLRDAAESARALIADSTNDAQRRSKDFVGEAMSQCDQLLRAAASVAEQAEKARSILAKAAGDAERHIVGLPGIAAQEAARVREAMRAETELLLDMSARTLATLQTRAQKRAPLPASEEAPAPTGEQQPQTELPDNMGEGLRGLARRITAPKRRPEERPKASYELSDVLAAAGRSDAAKGGGKAGSPAALNTLQTALAALAVDLEELSHDSSDPALWRRWLDGDRAVFARQLAASIGPQSVDRIAALYRDNSRFHETADAYLGEFETMLERSREADRDGLLASSLLTADTGKIYLAIAYALGRLE